MHPRCRALRIVLKVGGKAVQLSPTEGVKPGRTHILARIHVHEEYKLPL